MKIENCSHGESKEGTGSPQCKSSQRFGLPKSGVNNLSGPVRGRKRKSESSAHSSYCPCQSQLKESEEKVRKLAERAKNFEDTMNDRIQKEVQRQIRIELMKYPIFSAQFLDNVPTFVAFPTTAPAAASVTTTVPSKSSIPSVDLNVSAFLSDEHDDSCSSTG